jgi:integral membrane sensor domain MASE1
VAFWPVFSSIRFWVSAGIVIGIVGTFVTSIAIAQDKP